MAVGSIRLIDRVYPPGVQRLLQVVMLIALAVFAAVMALILTQPEWGLRILWFAAIPVAPMVLLVAPNAWVSVCPISTFQTALHRFGKNPARRLSAKATERLQVAGWGLMLAGIPTRHLVFNSIGWATFFTALAILGVVVVVGLSARSLSGWCVGACPIRPIEVLYGQFALDKNRPEKCTNCTACIKSCLRLQPQKSHDELHRSPLTAHLAMGFPGFVAAYFALDLLNWCNVEHEFFAGSASSVANWYVQTGIVYGVMFAGFAISWALFAALRPLWGATKTYRAVALAAFSAYYLGVAPEICEAWGWPNWVIPILLVLPAAAMAWVLWAARRDSAPPDGVQDVETAAG